MHGDDELGLYVTSEDLGYFSAAAGVALDRPLRKGYSRTSPPHLPVWPAGLECGRRPIGARGHEPRLARGVHGAVPGPGGQGL